jgi:hypothetical protein
MTKYLLVLCLNTVVFAGYSPGAEFSPTPTILASRDITQERRVYIDSIGDVRAILGTSGKNIAVCQHGDNIAVIYGGPTGSTTNILRVMIAYSTNSGSNWQRYGPFSPDARRIYSGVAGSANFCSQCGQLFFVWDGIPQIHVMIEENIPSAPFPSVPMVLPGSDTLGARVPSIAIDPNDPAHVVITGQDWFNTYIWISTDGGYSWTGPFPVCYGGDAGIITMGTTNNLFYAYLDYLLLSGADSILYPYYTESTDGGYTWGPETPFPGVPADTGSVFWWHEFDCLMINDEPWAVYTDVGDPGGKYILHGIGSPGNWTWEIFDAGQLGTCSLVIADTAFCCSLNLYPNLSYDPVSNTILASYKAYYYKEHAGTVYHNGAHIGGIYTTDNGANWTITQPLSEANTTQIPWNAWDATEVAYRLGNIAGDVWAYGIWVHELELILYFERGLVRSFLPLSVDETDAGSLAPDHFHVIPSVSAGRTRIEYSLSYPRSVRIDLYDASGRLVRNIYQGKPSPGHHYVDLNYDELPNGIYFVSFRTGSGVSTRKCVLVR